MQFISSYPGPFVMLALLALAILVVASMAMLVKMLPPGNQLRQEVESFMRWLKANPELAEKRFRHGAFILLMVFFVALTLIYS
jgi:hypothetical protein